MTRSAILLLVTMLVAPASAQIPAPYLETFDSGARGVADCLPGGVGSLPAGWNDGGGSGAFTVNLGSTVSPGTGPADDVTGGGLYVYAETSNGCNLGRFVLVSPQVNVSALVSSSLHLRAHLLGANIGVLSIEELDGASGQWHRIASYGNASFGDVWNVIEVPLGARAGPDLCQVRFIYEGASGFAGDLALDQISFGNAGAPVLPPIVPMAPEFETNGPESTLEIDGGQSAAVPTGAFARLDLRSNLVGNPYELLVSEGAAIGLSRGGLATSGLQTFNVSFLPGRSFGLNQLVFGGVLQHPGSVSYSILAGRVFQGVAQQIVADPGQVDGFSLSAPAEIETLLVRGANRLMLTDDGFATIGLMGPGIPFAGTVFTSVTVNANFNLSFGGANNSFSATVGAALGNATVGAWTDGNPAAGGFVSWSEAPNGFAAFWDDVPYFGETVGNSLGVAVEANGTVAMDLSLWRPNPLNASSTGDALFFGLSGGSIVGATDAGPSSFGAGLSGGNASPTDMIYRFLTGLGLAGEATPGLMDDIASLQTGSGILVFSPGLAAGSYGWVGL